MPAPYPANEKRATAGLSDKMVARLKIASAVMGVLIILALAGVGYGLYQNFAKLTGNAAQQAGEAVLTLPTGLSVQSIAAGPQGGLWLLLSGKGKVPGQLWQMGPDGQLIRQIELQSAD